jgi:transposase-like protein
MPVYQQIAPQAKQLAELGLSRKAIARALGVSDKTAAKAVEALPRFHSTEPNWSS